MISTQRIIYCINPSCNNPINPVGDSYCASCQTPLVHRYLKATGSLSAKIPPGTKVADRYEVITHHVWLDTQPGLPPDVPEELPKEVIPYLRLYQERLHLPLAYGFTRSFEEGASDILLLENVPIDEMGHIYPTIADAWEQATAVRQVYWLWQILQLWTPLSELGVARSLLILDNLRVQGWCVRLLELVETFHETSLQQFDETSLQQFDETSLQQFDETSLQQFDETSLQNLGQCWQPWVVCAKTPVAERLKNIVQQMCETQVELETISAQLNELLLSSAAELPLNLKVAGATDTGPVMAQNEDACYPSTSNLYQSILPHLSIVCDGIGGHEGGEVASQLAVQSLKLQIRALIAEVTQQIELVPPNLLQEQLEASLRVVNNVIYARNHEQKRQGRERMATTFVMAVQVPQRVQTTAGWHSENAHELYLANVGDSRAYWITRNYCQLLTADDDVATREVRLARSLYRKALLRPDATALTQALGTKDAESLRFRVQRFILEEDGILLLCSDGLSDNNWVEQSWQDYATPVLTRQLTVEDAVRNLINLANTKNGHDNTSVVLTYCRVSPEYLVPFTPPQQSLEIVEAEPQKLQKLEEQEEPTSFTQSSQALLDLDLDLDISEEPPVTKKPPIRVKKSSRDKQLVMLGGFVALVVGGTSLGLFAWSQLNPLGFQQMCRQLPQRVQQLCSFEN
ncbi:protein phosphatase 2C domain-containing protein [aff. Roholtiella sp. LEGE 12411]|uniref:protein phosphatase 2C domain-containing protein n=1 Tax=aff. Roholtiella sp. LEGE 12411 TaxID=1828822 RepID=UPI0018800FD4|nr:protein phosphatase 2C domain-containing protein [aff. Roholtiella sp. LEGE 12411]MBE9037817.1 protein phosphatase 2C domain-containing protein [aff. Roholtiella sp. LEGE 12411]